MCWSVDHPFGHKDLDSQDNSGEENEMQIVTPLDLPVHIIHGDQETLLFRINSFTVTILFVFPTYVLK